MEHFNPRQGLRSLTAVLGSDGRVGSAAVPRPVRVSSPALEAALRVLVPFQGSAPLQQVDPAGFYSF